MIRFPLGTGGRLTSVPVADLVGIRTLSYRYLYRAVDWAGQTLEFRLTAKRDVKAAKRFFRKLLKASHTSLPRVITVDKNAAYPSAFEDLHQYGQVPETCRLRQSKYLNNLVKQDHRAIKRLTRPMLGFQSLRTAWRTLRGIEILHMIGKDQVRGVDRGDIRVQNRFVAELFGLAA